MGLRAAFNNLAAEIDRIYLDGQLDECDLTLRDLHTVGRSISQVLAAVKHGRVDYPAPGKTEVGRVS